MMCLCVGISSSIITGGLPETAAAFNSSTEVSFLGEDAATLP